MTTQKVPPPPLLLLLRSLPCRSSNVSSKDFDQPIISELADCEPFSVLNGTAAYLSTAQNEHIYLVAALFLFVRKTFTTETLHVHIFESEAVPATGVLICLLPLQQPLLLLARPMTNLSSK